MNYRTLAQTCRSLSSTRLDRLSRTNSELWPAWALSTTAAAGILRPMHLTSTMAESASKSVAIPPGNFQKSRMLWKHRTNWAKTIMFHYSACQKRTIGWAYEWESGLDLIVFWWDRLLSDPEFENRLKSRWAELRENELRTERMLADIDSLALYLDEAQERNFRRWPILGGHVWPNTFVGETYQEEVEFLKGWLTERLAWMDANIRKGTFVRDESDMKVLITLD
jgi:hypothetical protein